MSISILENTEKGLELVTKKFIHYFKIISIPYILAMISFFAFLGFLFGTITYAKTMPLAAVLFGLITILFFGLMIKFWWDLMKSIIPICHLTKDLLYNQEVKSRKQYLDFGNNRSLKLFLLIITVFLSPFILGLIFDLIIFFAVFITKTKELWIIPGYINYILMTVIYFCCFLVIPVFVFEKGLTIFECIKRSFQIVRKNFVKMLLLYSLLIGLLTILYLLAYFIFMTMGLITFPIIFVSKLAMAIIFLLSSIIIIALFQIFTIIYLNTIPTIWYIEYTKAQQENASIQESNN